MYAGAADPALADRTHLYAGPLAPTMSDAHDRAREQGVEFGDLAAEIERLDYPVSNANVVERCGDEELVLVDGSVTLRETLEPHGEATYEDADQVRQAVLNVVAAGAVGRKGYTDRGSNPADDLWQRDHQESF